MCRVQHFEQSLSNSRPVLKHCSLKFVRTRAIGSTRIRPRLSPICLSLLRGLICAPVKSHHVIANLFKRLRTLWRFRNMVGFVRLELTSSCSKHSFSFLNKNGQVLGIERRGQQGLRVQRQADLRDQCRLEVRGARGLTRMRPGCGFRDYRHCDTAFLV